MLPDILTPPAGTHWQGEGTCIKCGCDIGHGDPWTMRTWHEGHVRRSGMVCRWCATHLDNLKGNPLSLFCSEGTVNMICQLTFAGAIVLALVLWAIFRLIGWIDADGNNIIRKQSTPAVSMVNAVDSPAAPKMHRCPPAPHQDM